MDQHSFIETAEGKDADVEDNDRESASAPDEDSHPDPRSRWEVSEIR